MSRRCRGAPPASRRCTGSAGALAKWVLAPYYTTIRIVGGPEVRARMLRHPRPSGIYAFWHSHHFTAVWHFRPGRRRHTYQRVEGRGIHRAHRAVGRFHAAARIVVAARRGRAQGADRVRPQRPAGGDHARRPVRAEAFHRPGRPRLGAEERLSDRPVRHRPFELLGNCRAGTGSESRSRSPADTPAGASRFGSRPTRTPPRWTGSPPNLARG